MSACRTVGRWITENVTTPVERSAERAEEVCKEVRRRIEREVRRKVERRRERQERRCRRRKCNPWCACCNKWFCWIETIVERVVEWVIEVVVEWVVETVCRTVVKLVKIVVMVVVAVLRFVVTGVVCLVTDPAGALVALGDLWFDLVNALQEVVELADFLLGQVADLLDISARFVKDLGHWFGPVGRVIFGAIGGILDGVRQIVDGVRQIVRGVGDAVLDVLRLDFCGFVEDLAYGLSGVGKIVTGGLAVATVGSGGVRDAFVSNSASADVREIVQANLADDRAARVINALNLGGSTWGMDWEIRPYRLAISSRNRLGFGRVANPALPPFFLRDLHEQGQINLYKIAGYAPICDDKVFKDQRWTLVYRDTSRRVSLADLRDYLNDDPGEVPEFELMAIERSVFERHLDIMKRSFRTLGLRLEMEPMERLEVSDPVEFNLTRQPNTRPFPKSSVELMLERTGRDDQNLQLCWQPVVAVFQYEEGLFGLAMPIWPNSSRPRLSRDKATGATYRDFQPEIVFGYVAAHELGHVFGLQHEGHDGVEHIMYTAAEDADLDSVTVRTLTEFILLGGEPRFTAADVRTAWTWITQVADGCLPEEEVEDG
jgi:hypothetical protein